MEYSTCDIAQQTTDIVTPLMPTTCRESSCHEIVDQAEDRAAGDDLPRLGFVPDDQDDARQGDGDRPDIDRGRQDQPDGHSHDGGDGGASSRMIMLPRRGY